MKHRKCVLPLEPLKSSKTFSGGDYNPWLLVPPLFNSSSLQLHCGLTFIWYLGVSMLETYIPLNLCLSCCAHNHPPVLSRAHSAAPSLLKDTVCLSVSSSPMCPFLWQLSLLDLLLSWSDPEPWLSIWHALPPPPACLQPRTAFSRVWECVSATLLPHPSP